MRHVIKGLYCTHLRDESNRIIPIRYIFNDKFIIAHDIIFSGKEFDPANEKIMVECTSSVMPTKIDSDVIFCLKLFSKI